jgi:hypothetical protein
MMRQLQALSVAVGLGLGMAPTPLLAAAYDGSVPLLCAVIEVFDCQGAGDCQRGTADSVNLPQFLKIDFKEKTLSTTEAGEGKKVTPIKHVERVEGHMILQGVEGGRRGQMSWIQLMTEV